MGESRQGDKGTIGIKGRKNEEKMNLFSSQDQP